MNTHWIICFSITIKTSACVLLKLILFSHSSLYSYSFIINRLKLVLQLSTNHSSVRIIVICTASLDHCKRQRDTLRQNVETIPEGPLPNSLLWGHTRQLWCLAKIVRDLVNFSSSFLRRLVQLKIFAIRMSYFIPYCTLYIVHCTSRRTSSHTPQGPRSRIHEVL